MRITESALRRIIREEVLREARRPDTSALRDFSRRETEAFRSEEVQGKLRELESGETSPAEYAEYFIGHPKPEVTSAGAVAIGYLKPAAFRLGSQALNGIPVGGMTLQQAADAARDAVTPRNAFARGFESHPDDIYHDRTGRFRRR